MLIPKWPLYCLCLSITALLLFSGKASFFLNSKTTEGIVLSSNPGFRTQAIVDFEIDGIKYRRPFYTFIGSDPGEKVMIRYLPGDLKSARISTIYGLFEDYRLAVFILFIIFGSIFFIGGTDKLVFLRFPWTKSKPDFDPSQSNGWTLPDAKKRIRQ